ncbi:hypothetical protein HPB48_024307 [Haemaphysalis longicornis]|uniref:Uncharacterized protein n=1 Tax=Haemaphysalis longicornis TaxID=44386 RepID=A0A9J6H7I5_HAELO|nr:hypothetical protein HPB48_024307 [Haemaphysalis longicornis]
MPLCSFETALRAKHEVVITQVRPQDAPLRVEVRRGKTAVCSAEDDHFGTMMMAARERIALISGIDTVTILFAPLVTNGVKDIVKDIGSPALARP